MNLEALKEFAESEVFGTLEAGSFDGRTTEVDYSSLGDSNENIQMSVLVAYEGIVLETDDEGNFTLEKARNLVKKMGIAGKVYEIGSDQETYEVSDLGEETEGGKLLIHPSGEGEVKVVVSVDGTVFTKKESGLYKDYEKLQAEVTSTVEAMKKDLKTLCAAAQQVCKVETDG